MVWASFLSVLAAVAPGIDLGEDDPPGEGQIIVEGNRAEGDQKKVVNRAIRALLQAEGANQYARFEHPVCPSAIGFPEAIGDAIEDRVRIVAEAGGTGAGPQDCKPNLHIVLVDNGPEMIRMVRSKRQGAFGWLQPSERDRIAKEPGPVYNWHAVFPVSAENGEPVDDGFLVTAVASRILQPVTQNIAHAVVLVERKAVDGVTAIQLADFAAMRGMLKVKGPDEGLGKMETIMRLFDAGTMPEDHPPSLSQWDLALLRALYAVRSDRTADRQRSAMVRFVVKDLAEGE